MRLSEEQQQHIHEAVCLVFGENAQVYLFGSRVDDSKRGGDIDLYLEVNDSPDWFQRKLRLGVELVRRLGERKIDLLVHRHGTPKSAIHQIAKASGVIL
ncbi:MAG: nucleotidyltransferase domain-containing protein [Mariprofundus sp.]